MSLYPEEDTCVLCDLPWKNNRVSYDGSSKMNVCPRHLEVGSAVIDVTKDGKIRIGEREVHTNLAVNDQTIAFDALHGLLYFASETRMIAYDVKRKNARFSYECENSPGAPILYEWLLPNGEICMAVGFSDGRDGYIALERETGVLLWRAYILGPAADAAAHDGGRLYLTLAGTPFYVLCLEAQNGEVIWWNKGHGKALYAVLCRDTYCVKDVHGVLHRFAKMDGEKIQ